MKNLSPKRILTETLSPKRLIAGALACLMLGSIFIPAFAEGQPSGGTWTDPNAGGGAGGGGGRPINWTLSSGAYGYKISLIYSPKTTFDYTSPVPTQTSRFFKTIVTLNGAAYGLASDDAYISNSTTLAQQRSLTATAGQASGGLTYYAGGYSSWNASNMEDNLPYMTNFGPLMGSMLPAGRISQDALGVYVGSEVADYLGHPSGVASKVNTAIPLYESSEAAEIIFSSIARDMGSGASIADVAGMVSLDKTFKQGIIDEAGDDDLEVLKDYILPLSSNCKVGWAMIVEPIYVWQTDGSNIGIDPKYKALFVTATDANAAVAASAGYLDNIHKQYENKQAAVTSAVASGNAQSINAKTKELVNFQNTYSTFLNISGHTTYGMFASLYASWNNWAPMNLYTTQSWFGIPAAGGAPGTFLDVLTTGGYGVGIIKNDAVEATPDEEPENPPPVYIPPEVSFPVIEEDHLSQICETTVLESTSNKSDVCADFTFRPTAMSFSRI